MNTDADRAKIATALLDEAERHMPAKEYRAFLRFMRKVQTPTQRKML